MEFKYNHEGLRTRKVKKVNGTVTETTDYILKGKLIAAMKKNTDTYYFTYNIFGKPVTVNFNGAEYTYVKNFQGDIVGILDASGDLVVEYMYDAWGDAVSIYSASTTIDALAFDNPFRYRGYVWDEETELYYLSSRYYNPEISRFINADSLVSTGQRILGNNMHAYCRNNPVRRKDVTGTASVEIFDADGNLLTDDVLRFDGGSVSIGGFGINSSYVWAEEPETGERALKRVVQTFLKEKDELVHIQVGSETITCTTEHPFYVQGKGWVAAQDLKPNDKLELRDCEDAFVDAVRYEKLDKPIPVFNFEVEGFHTYYVGAGCVLVHNTCGNHGKEWQKKRRNYWKTQGAMYENKVNQDALSASGKYNLSQGNINRMKNGRAPIGTDGLSVSLHHNTGILANIDDFSEILTSVHRKNYRSLHHWLFN